MPELGILGAGSLLIAILLLLPLVFEREVRESRFLSQTFRLKYLQHLFPHDGERTGRAFSRWLPERDRWSPVDAQSVSRRTRSVRALTGADLDNHIKALHLCGELIRDIASRPGLEPSPGDIANVLSAGDIICFVASQLDPQFEPSHDVEQRELQLQAWLRQNPVELDLVVELVLSAAQVLQARMQLSDDATPSAAANAAKRNRAAS